MRRVRLTDTETTGLNAEARVIEIAVLTCRVQTHKMTCLSENGKPLVDVAHWEHHETSLIRPEPWVKCDPGARANHHITDDELKCAPALGEVLMALSKPELDDITCGHNLEFDERMMRQTGLESLLTRQRICTLRCARHVWPQFESHSNQALRYALDLDVRELPNAKPHRALPDVFVTVGIFERLLAERSLDELIAMTGAVPLQRICNMKAHKGKPWSQVPADYLRWIMSANPAFSEEIRATAEHWLNEAAKKRMKK